MKKQTAKHGGSISIPRRGGFSLSVGKYVVKGVRCKKECLDLCCKYTCLRHIWQYAGGIIHRNLGCAQLRWQKQRIRKQPLKSFDFRGFCRVSTEKMPFAHHLLYRSEIFFLISGVITFLYCCAISQNWIFSSSVTSFFLHRVLNKVGFPPRKIYRRLSGI